MTGTIPWTNGGITNPDQWQSERTHAVKRIIIAIAFALAVIGGSAGAAMAVASQQPTAVTNYCVTFGHGTGAAGNVVEFNWDGSQCPAGTYPHELRVKDSDPFLPPNFYLNSASPVFGGSHSGMAFEITDQATTPNTVYDCVFGVPVAMSGSALFTPEVVCTKAG